MTTRTRLLASAFLLSLTTCAWLASADGPNPAALHGAEPAATSSSDIASLDPPEVLLLDGRSVLGWRQIGAHQNQGWNLADGWLTGTPDSGTLLFDGTFGEAAWTLHLKTEPGSGLELSLPHAEEGQGREMRLPMQFRFTSRTFVAPPDTSLESERVWPRTTVVVDGEQTIVLHRTGSKMEILLNGKNLATVSALHLPRTGIALRTLSGKIRIATLGVREHGFRPLFNGQNLTEFNVGDARVRWTVDAEGKIVTESPAGNYLRTNELFHNFVLSLEYRISAGGNSGIGIRTPVGGWPSSDGMEVQILDQPASAPIFSGSVGSLYRNMPPVRRNDLPNPAWNRMTIKADGPLILVWINGQLVNHCNVARHYVLRSRSRTGWIGFQDHGGRAEFRKIVVAPAATHAGLPEWAAAEPETAAGMILGPALDPVELLRQRKSAPRIVEGMHVPGSARTSTLAEFTGPGALVRLYRSNDSGELAFFFDGSAEPKIIGSWKSLPSTVPDLGHSAREQFTYVPFAKSLRIEQRGSAPTQFQFGTAALPQETPLASWPLALTGEDRGWQHAIEYLQHNHAYGTTSRDPAVRELSTDARTIPPEGTAILAETADGGLARWLRLTIPDPGMLRDESLWLDVHVDGEPRPAISAPARLLLSAILPEWGEQPPGDLLQVRQRDQYTWLWPIPCRTGIRLVGRNRGSVPLAGLKGTIGLLPLPPKLIPLARLRGHAYQPSSGTENELLSATGRGKLVYLCLQAPEGLQTAKISALRIDGQPQAGWAKVSLGSWLGRDVPPLRHATGMGGDLESLCWRNFLLDPIPFQKNLELIVQPAPVGWNTLALYYIQSTTSGESTAPRNK